MSELSQAEQYLLEQIRNGEAQAWSQLVERYQGRLLAFAQTKLKQRADAEDIVQDTFMGFLKGWQNFRGQASLETYLFTILRRKVINSYRSKKVHETCLLQDVYRSSWLDEKESDPMQQIAGNDPSASWYLKRDERHDQQLETLTAALRDLLAGYKKSLNFRDMKIVELIFYCHLSNKDVAEITGVNDKNIAVIKHRCIQQVRQKVQKSNVQGDEDARFENLLSEAWETQRLSCPKRSTIGAFLLGTLDSEWEDYVAFHLNKLGCHFCRANMEDLQEKTSEGESRSLQKRIMESTVGFLSRPN